MAPQNTKTHTLYYLSFLQFHLSRYHFPVDVAPALTTLQDSTYVPCTCLPLLLILRLDGFFQVEEILPQHLSSKVRHSVIAIFGSPQGFSGRS